MVNVIYDTVFPDFILLNFIFTHIILEAQTE